MLHAQVYNKINVTRLKLIFREYRLECPDTLTQSKPNPKAF